MNQPQNKNNSFFDRSTIIGFIVITIFFFGWNYYVAKKYPPTPATEAATQATPESEVKTGAQTQAAGLPGVGGKAPVEKVEAPKPGAPEQFLDFTSETFSFRVSSLGMGLKDLNILSYKTRDNKPIILGQAQDHYAFSTYLVGSDDVINFALTQTSPTVITGTAQVGAMTIVKTFTVDPNRYLVEADVKVSGAGQDFKGLTTYLNEIYLDQPKGGMFAGRNFDTQDLFVLHEGSEKHNILHRPDAFNLSEKNVEVAAIGSHYFTLAFINKADLFPHIEANYVANTPQLMTRLVHAPVNPSSEFHIAYQAYAGPKQLSVLESVDSHLAGIIQYGMFAIIAKPLLKLLKLLNSFLFNYGWSIVLLTIIVRVLVLPFNIYSMRSMKAMQKIQPEMNRIKEKYKNDPPTMNREVMALMKHHKANPLGGCLPMLLQIPVFFALYQVLGQSIELYRAPFIIWIQDLSMHDPFYVLPVAMGISMFLQQKLTPTAMDPTQRKMMMFMPLVFSFFMLNLPSGLTLYIFVSTVFGIAQQYAFMRDKNPEANNVSRVQA